MDSVKRQVAYRHFAVKTQQIGLSILICLLSACGGGSGQPAIGAAVATPSDSSTNNASPTQSVTPPTAQNPGNPAEQTSIPAVFEPVDTDSDGIRDSEDAFPFNNRESEDTDGDGTGDNADDDDDNDGVLDVIDAFPFDIRESVDSDADGTGNNTAPDDDNDGVLDVDDAFPTDPGESSDTDGDNQGDNSDPDIDNDGIANAADYFPYDIERYSLKDAMQGNWTSSCIPDAESSYIVGQQYSGAQLYSAIVFFNDTSCSDFQFSTLSDSTFIYLMNVEYGDEIVTSDGRSAQRIDLQPLKTTADSQFVPVSSQNFISIEGDTMYEGTIDENNPGVYELADDRLYTRADSFIASELIDTVDTPVVEKPVVVRETVPTTNHVNEDRTQPTPGSFLNSDNTTLKFNGADLFSNTGPQRVDVNRVVSWPGLRYGNFLVSNNPWNASAANWPGWYQEISLLENNNSYAVNFNWDWGSALDTHSRFNSKSFPEVIYGTKSAEERSGTFAETGLPIEIFDAPEITIDYEYDYEVRQSDSTSAKETDSEFNVKINSIFHDSCDIQATGGPTDNRVFEMAVWLKAGNIKPSSDGLRNIIITADGYSFDVYTKTSNFHYIAFVAHTETQAGSIQYSELLNHAKDYASRYGIYQLEDTDCLANIIMGTEIWHGAGSFNLKRFQVNRRY